MVIDETGLIHVFWIDEYAGYFYRSGDGETWEDRVRVIPPFEPYSPRLILGRDNRIYAFWINESGNLYWSRASADELSSGVGWESAQWMAGAVVDFSVTVDDEGVLQVSYIFNEDETGVTAGVEFQSSSNNGASWSAPLLLYQSPYMRGLQPVDANVELATTKFGEGRWVYTGWDNRVRKQIFLARSLDGGQSWDESILVDGPDPADPNSIPYNLQVAAFEENAILVWQRGQQGASCSLYYRWSRDGGNNWSEPQQMQGAFQGCPEEIRFIGGGEGYVLLQGTYPSQILIQAWDGTKWSDPKLQSQLSTFEDSDTYGIIDFVCPQFVRSPSEELLSVIGCDRTGEDVWYSEREIGDTTTWFPSPPIWTEPVAISTARSEFGEPVIVASEDEMLHTFWSQLTEGNNTSNSRTEIYSSHWDGERWSRPSPVLSSPLGNASQPAVVEDQNNHLLAVWVGIDTGEVYFSKAAVSRSQRGSDWSTPLALPAPALGARSPQILPFGARQVYAIYSVPLNEARGIYITTSNDSGNTWSQPTRVFDATQAGWDRVDSPSLARAEDGSLHVLFTRYSLPGGSGPMEMYYSRSEDHGKSWSQPDPVSQNPVFWSRIVSGSDGVLHRVWQAPTPNNIGFLIRHQYSLDQGLLWSAPETVSNSTMAGSNVLPTLVATSSEVLHLLHTGQNASGENSLNHWVWSGDQWVRRDDLVLGMKMLQPLSSIAAAASPTGRLAVISSGSSAEESVQKVSTYRLLFNIRALDISIPPAAPLPTIQPSITPTPEPTLEPTITPTPPLDLSALANQAPPRTSTNRWTSVGVGLSLAGILVAAALSIAVVKRRK